MEPQVKNCVVVQFRRQFVIEHLKQFRVLLGLSQPKSVQKTTSRTAHTVQNRSQVRERFLIQT